MSSMVKTITDISSNNRNDHDRLLPSTQTIPLTSQVKPESRPMPIHFGQDIKTRQPLEIELSSIIHLLIAGRSGSGKTVMLQNIIRQLIAYSPDEIRLAMIDPKLGADLGLYSDIPHLLYPLVTDVNNIPDLLTAVIHEMDNRMRRKAQELTSPQVRGFDQQVPWLVLIIEELADLFLVQRDYQTALIRLAQRGRAAKILCVLVTQRPSVDILPGLLLANIPSRLCFAVTSRCNSHIVLDTSGAEKIDQPGKFLVRSPMLGDITLGYCPMVEKAEILEKVKTAHDRFAMKRYKLRSLPRCRHNLEPTVQTRSVSNDRRTRISWIQNIWRSINFLSMQLWRIFRLAILALDLLIKWVEQMLNSHRKRLERSLKK